MGASTLELAGFTAPTVDDARKVAAVIAGDPNVVRVLLFGSVARGEQTSVSDIDLLVVHRDLDYATRVVTEERLAAAGQDLTGRQVQVRATDVVEWDTQIQVPNSFDADVCRSGVLPLYERPVDLADVNWHKEQRLTTDPLAQAVSYLHWGLGKRLRTLNDTMVVSDRRQAQMQADEDVRLSKVEETVAAAVLVVELGLKSFANLVASGTLNDSQLRSAGHAIDECLELIGEPYQSAYTDALVALELDPKSIGKWRTSPYPVPGVDEDGAPTIASDEDTRLRAQMADEHADQALHAALTISDNVLAEFEERVDLDQVTAGAVAVADAVLDTFEAAAPTYRRVAAVRSDWAETKLTYELIDVHTFAPRSTPLDLSTVLMEHRQTLQQSVGYHVDDQPDLVDHPVEAVQPGQPASASSPVEQARDLRRAGWKVKDIAVEVHRDPSWVSRHTKDVAPPKRRQQRR